MNKAVVQETDTKMKKSIESMRREFSEVRTGRAHPGLIEGLHIDYYGTLTLLKQVASITIPDPKTIVIQPWDVTAIPEIEKAINNSKLGVTPMNDGKIVRISIPPLSEERREEMKRTCRDMSEKGKVSLRTIRRDANDKIKKMLTDKTMSEDENFKTQEEIQKLTDRYIKDIDQMLEDKNKELTQHK